jgi:hypothetical protein
LPSEPPVPGWALWMAMLGTVVLATEPRLSASRLWASDVLVRSGHDRAVMAADAAAKAPTGLLMALLLARCRSSLF